MGLGTIATHQEDDAARVLGALCVLAGRPTLERRWHDHAHDVPEDLLDATETALSEPCMEDVFAGSLDHQTGQLQMDLMLPLAEPLAQRLVDRLT